MKKNVAGSSPAIILRNAHLTFMARLLRTASEPTRARNHTSTRPFDRTETFPTGYGIVYRRTAELPIWLDKQESKAQCFLAT